MLVTPYCPLFIFGLFSQSDLVVSGKLDQIPVRIPDVYRGNSPKRASPADRTTISPHDAYEARQPHHPTNPEQADTSQPSRAQACPP